MSEPKRVEKYLKEMGNATAARVIKENNLTKVEEVACDELGERLLSAALSMREKLIAQFGIDRALVILSAGLQLAMDSVKQRIKDDKEKN